MAFHDRRAAVHHTVRKVLLFDVFHDDGKHGDGLRVYQHFVSLFLPDVKHFVHYDHLGGFSPIHGIKIMENMHGGKFVAMPSAKSKNGTGGKYYDIVHPVTAEFRCQLNDAIMQEYRKLLSKHQSQAATAGEPLPEQIAIEENNIPHQAQESTLFDYY